MFRINTNNVDFPVVHWNDASHIITSSFLIINNHDKNFARIWQPAHNNMLWKPSEISKTLRRRIVRFFLFVCIFVSKIISFCYMFTYMSTYYAIKKVRKHQRGKFSMLLHFNYMHMYKVSFSFCTYFAFFSDVRVYFNVHVYFRSFLERVKKVKSRARIRQIETFILYFLIVILCHVDSHVRKGRSHAVENSRVSGECLSVVSSSDLNTSLTMFHSHYYPTR